MQDFATTLKQMLNLEVSALFEWARGYGANFDGNTAK